MKKFLALFVFAFMANACVTPQDDTSPLFISSGTLRKTVQKGSEKIQH
jgi:hypothetical protein